MSATDYEQVPYEDRPVAETHPDRLFVAARQNGFPAAHPANARVLEIGCAHAANLMPMAAYLPDAGFVGIDLSPRQIEVAKSRAQAIGLRNLDLRCCDLVDYDPGQRRFDYVIAHGVFSWVPDPVRDRLLGLCREALADHGVAYVSYNTLPAWGVRGGVRRALLELARGSATAAERIAAARRGIARLAEIMPLAGTAEGELLRQEIEALRGKDDAYLLHEYLAPSQRAYYVSEFVELAQGHGLAYLGETADPGVPPATELSTRTRWLDEVGDRIGAEQLTDISLFRQFRASLLVRADAPRPAAATGDWRARCHVALAGGDADRARSDPALGRLLAELERRWPGDLPRAALAEWLDEGADVDRTIDDAVLRGELAWRPRALPGPRAVPGRPRAHALARLEAGVLGFVTTPDHGCAILDEFHRALVRRLDGEHGVPELAAAVADDIESGRLRLADGQAPPPRERLVSGLGPMIEQALAVLGRSGLLA